jgi:PEGA domain
VAIIRIPRLWPGAARAAAASTAPAVAFADPLADSLEAFGSETEPHGLSLVPKPVPPTSGELDRAAPRDWSGVIAALKWVGVMLFSATTAGLAVWEYQRRTVVPPTGSVTIQTTPPGREVLVDGRSLGLSPVTVALAPASYAFQIGRGAERRDLAVDVRAGSSILQHLELPSTPATPVTTTGALHVQTEPSGQTISVDGVERGQSPITVSNLSSGDHTVVARGTAGTVRRTVAVKAGESISLVFSPTSPVTPAPGWLSVHSDTRLELRENGKLIGTTETEQLMLSAGTHDIEIVNEAVGYRSSRQVEVASGKTTNVSVELPFGAININAQPWAEVWIAGERIGETPIANLSRRVGSYEIVFRHPQLGERRENVLVTLRQPVRLGVDMRGK